MKSKICGDCKTEKQFPDSFYRRNNYNNTEAVYYKPFCKDCAKTRTRNWVKINIERFKKYQKGYNRTKRCRT